MAPSSSSKPKDRGSRKGPRDREGEDTSSLNLWVGSLSSDTVDYDLIKIFSEYGAMDALTSYTPRTYAFVFFRTADEAKKAKEALQGKVVRGVPIKIEFARTAKPGKSLWIGGISSSVTKEQLEDELSQYGKLEEYKFLRDRNSALVGYCKLDDAVAAHKNMNGKSLGGEHIRVDFQKPQYLRNDLPDHHNSKGRRSMGPQEPWMSPDDLSFHTSLNQGSKRYLPSQPHGGRRDGPPSNTLWIGYPPSVHVDEQMLHNAMILFGEIEKIKCFPTRHYSFVQFRSIDEARRAKEGLQGRLFGDSRIQILFTNSEIGSGKDSASVFPGYRGLMPDTPFNEPSFGTTETSRPMGPNSYSRQFLPNGPSVRQFSAQGFDPRQLDPDYHDFGGPVPNFPDSDPNASNWKRLPPFPGAHSSSLGMRLRPLQGEWDDGFDMRELKRSRVEGMGDTFGLPHPERIPGQSHSPAFRGPSRLHGSPDIDHCWRGVIAKGGSPVCHARCVPIGKGLESPLPEIVNCFARTDLDTLAKKYGEAIGFDIVFFLPDSEEDFGSYTEFLQYLGLKNRVGVAKCDDGITLFLVPPSEFLTKVLKVSGPERLYGVVLKLPNQPAAEVQQPQVASLQPPLPYSKQLQELASQESYNYVPKIEDRALGADYSAPHAGVGIPHTGEHYSMPIAPHDYVRNPEATSKVGVSLTPELIATLASFIPPNSQSSATGSNSNMPSSSSTPSFSANLASVPSGPAQGWVQERQSTFSASQSEPVGNTQQHLQHFGSQYGTQAPYMSQYTTYANLPNGPESSIQPGLGITQVQDLVANMPQVSATPTRLLDNYAHSPSNVRHQHNSNFDSYSGRGVQQATDFMGYSAPTNSSSQGQTANMYQNQTIPNAGFSAPVQQTQMAISRPGEDSSAGDVDKNQRYQSTLQFAASLLQKIQQQQQGGSHAVGGSGNQL